MGCTCETSEIPLSSQYYDEDAPVCDYFSYDNRWDWPNFCSHTIRKSNEICKSDCQELHEHCILNSAEEQELAEECSVGDEFSDENSNIVLQCSDEDLQAAAKTPRELNQRLSKPNAQDAEIAN